MSTSVLLYWYEEKSWSVQGMNSIVEPKKRYGELYSVGETVKARFAGACYPGVIVEIGDRECLKAIGVKVEKIVSSTEGSITPEELLLQLNQEAIADEDQSDQHPGRDPVRSVITIEAPRPALQKNKDQSDQHPGRDPVRSVITTEAPRPALQKNKEQMMESAKKKRAQDLLLKKRNRTQSFQDEHERTLNSLSTSDEIRRKKTPSMTSHGSGSRSKSPSLSEDEELQILDEDTPETPRRSPRKHQRVMEDLTPRRSLHKHRKEQSTSRSQSVFTEYSRKPSSNSAVPKNTWTSSSHLESRTPSNARRSRSVSPEYERRRAPVAHTSTSYLSESEDDQLKETSADLVPIMLPRKSPRKTKTMSTKSAKSAYVQPKKSSDMNKGTSDSEDEQWKLVVSKLSKVEKKFSSLKTEIEELKQDNKQIRRKLRKLEDKGRKEEEEDDEILFNQVTKGEVKKMVNNQSKLQSAVRNVMLFVYGEEYIVSHSMTGRAGNTNIPAKPSMDTNSLGFIRGMLVNKFGCTDSDITTKISNIQKALRKKLL